MCTRMHVHAPPTGTLFLLYLLGALLQEHQLSLCWVVLFILNVI